MAVSTHSERLRFAPKVPVAWVVQLYRRDALLLQDEELVGKVGGRLYARCMDIIANLVHRGASGALSDVGPSRRTGSLKQANDPIRQYLGQLFLFARVGVICSLEHTQFNSRRRLRLPP